MSIEPRTMANGMNGKMSMQKFLGAVVATVIALAATGANVIAAEVAKLPPDERYSLEAPTGCLPTTQWLGDKPVGGQLSVLIIDGTYDFWEQHGRKMVELKRSLGIDAEYAMCYISKTIGTRCDEQRIRQLLASRHWDVILNWAMNPCHGPGDNWSQLPADLRADLYRTVMEDGTGLLHLCFTPTPEFCRADRKQPSDARQVFAGLSLLSRQGRQAKLESGKLKPLVAELGTADAYYSLFKMGKGVALVCDPAGPVTTATIAGLMSHSEMVPYSATNRIDGEYFHAEMARLLYRAAGRSFAVEFTSAPGAVLGEVDAIPGQTMTWKFKNTEAVTSLKATWRLRNREGHELAGHSAPVALSTVGGEVVVTLPQLEPGSYMVDLFLDSPRGRENFGTAGVIVKQSATVEVAVLPLATIDPQKSPIGLLSVGVLPGKPANGQVTVVAKAGAPAITTATILLKDDFDRILGSQLVTLGADGKGTFSFPTTNIERIPLRVEAKALSADGKVRGSASAAFALMQTRRDRFQVSLAGGAGDPWALLTNQALWRQGVTMTSSHESAHGNLGCNMFSGMGGFRGMFRGQQFDDSIGLASLYKLSYDQATGVRELQPAPWNDPVAFKEILDLTQWNWDDTSRYPTPGQILYDEGSVQACDTSVPGMKAWQEWLRAEYKDSIAALNLEWNSSFTKFEEITETTAQRNEGSNGDLWEAGALAAGNPARWCDRRIFANQNYANLILEGVSQRAKVVDPGARIGLSGTFGFHHWAMDYTHWLKHGGLWTPYSTPRGVDFDLIRSNKPKDYSSSYWIGYHNGSQLPMVWDMVFRGANAVWWFQMPGDNPYGWLARNDVPYYQRQLLIDQAILPLRRGLGDLLMRLDQKIEGVAMYYSPQISLASMNDAVPDGTGPSLGKEWGTVGGCASGGADLTRDAQREFLYLDKARVLNGELPALGTKLMLLPMAQALSDEEIAKLRVFAEAGGVIVADVRPGVLSGRIRPIANGPADEFFGIKRSGPGKAKKVTINGKVTFAGSELDIRLPEVVADAEITPTTAKAALVVDGVPLLMTNKVGKGTVHLLNFGFESYGGVRENAAAGTGWRTLYAALLTEAQVPALAKLVGEDNGKTRNPLARLNVWEQGGVRLFGVLDGAGSGSITWPAKNFVFDLRRGPLGQVDHAPVEPFAADTAHFFAVYPYDPGKPAVTTAQPTIKAGAQVEFAIAMSGVPANETGTFSFHTRLVAPDGTWTDVIPWSVQGAGGRATVAWKSALNDPPGAWKLEVREITTGRSAVCAVRVDAQ